MGSPWACHLPSRVLIAFERGPVDNSITSLKLFDTHTVTSLDI